MRQAALHMSDEIDDLLAKDESWDVIVTTDMLNVAEFRSIANSVIRDLPTIVYFHENQFVYPTKTERKRDMSFAFTNLTTAIAADRAWFNSRFNLDSMIEQIREQSDSSPDISLKNAITRIRANSSIQYPGIDVPMAQPQENNSDKPIHLVWAARWEHDKNPTDLLKTLELLEARQFEFRLSVIGQSYQVIPDAFLQIEHEFKDRIVHWGFLPNRDDYWQVLANADILISTANHEFFGLSVIEGIAAGAYPLLPNRLSYPEVLNVGDFPERDLFLYDGTPRGLANKIQEICLDRSLINCNSRIILAEYVAETYGWPTRAKEMDHELDRLVQDHQNQPRFDPVH